MTERGRPEGRVVEEPDGGQDGSVRIHESRPGRLVFTEDGNTDGWIATDLAVDLEP